MTDYSDPGSPDPGPGMCEPDDDLPDTANDNFGVSFIDDDAKLEPIDSLTWRILWVHAQRLRLPHPNRVALLINQILVQHINDHRLNG